MSISPDLRWGFVDYSLMTGETTDLFDLIEQIPGQTTVASIETLSQAWWTQLGESRDSTSFSQVLAEYNRRLGMTDYDDIQRNPCIVPPDASRELDEHDWYEHWNSRA